MAVAPLVVTIGDPNGIGIEIISKAWMQRDLNNLPVFFLLGNVKTIEHYLKSTGIAVPFLEIASPADAANVFSKALPVLSLEGSNSVAEEIILSIRRGTEYCLSGEASALVTNPIQKKRLYDTGFSFPGHTEYLASLTGVTDQAVMMLACRELKVIPATIHVPLNKVPALLSADLLTHVISTAHRDLNYRFGIANPRIVVAGLNPHAGEDGSIGTEEVDIISPAIKNLQQSGMDVKGPFPADSLFHKAARGKYDAAICMYHDQALISIKTIDFDGGVNITLGLPIIRTSPDHGTAEDIHGKGIANPTSLIEAMKIAAEIASIAND
ncbi:4-hydroxythreonine-4-phosphate dehydrogenase PdxA [Sneathiella marina]|uniref:4-hydroxythreonine-4-phosphate dehydrogenase n=1 Tax=Sneathiella marina TaxID=2950108 RepID=A0ABY4VZH0_9PROT|nr:4-hydroxythreonine-4-phosphate dehydrogenase PdxA [Sneathiella marina]USG59984.1 4-hydroxythreonine-4-phosphate dehydrogenase PdxA [Sneathiella marina]